MQPSQPPPLRDLFNHALTMPPEQRPALLNWVGERWPDLRMELESMLAEHDRSGAPTLAPPTQQPSAPPPPPPPSYAVSALPYNGVIGSYRLIRELGRGGMGTVYLAVRDDDAFRKTVALKVIRKDTANEDFIRRFKLERQILAALDHPHITRIIDGGTTLGGEPYYVMDYVEGVALEKHCDTFKLSIADRVKLMVQLCDAVAYLHENAIIHRDLKPGNVLVDKDGRVRLLDFGIAKVLSLLPPEKGGSDGPTMIMTPGYASPEQIGGKAASRSSDQYSLGVILYMLLTGRGPYISPTGEQDFTSQLSGQLPPAPSTVTVGIEQRTAQTEKEFRRRVGGDLDRIVLKVLRADPNQRYESVAAFGKDLQSYLDGKPVSASPESAMRSLGRGFGRNKAVVVLAVLLVVALAGGGFFGVQLYVERARAEARQAQLEQLFDGLDTHLTKWGGMATEERLADVKAAGKILDTEAPAILAAPRADLVRLAKLVDRAVSYFDRTSALSMNDAPVIMEISSGYERAAKLQAAAVTKSGVGSTDKARTTYRKAAAVVLAAPSLDENWRQQRLQQLNAGSSALGAPLNISTGTEQDAEAAPASPAPAPATHQTPAAPQPQPPAPPPPVASQPAPQPARPSAPAADPREVQEVTERLEVDMMQLNRAKKNLEELRKRLMEKGQTVQADTETAMGQAQSYLDQARFELSHGDPARAKERLVQAEYTLKKVFRAVGN